MKNIIVVINPGSTSTKLALFNETELIIEQDILHTYSDLQKFPNIPAQKDFRMQVVLQFLNQQKCSLTDVRAVVGRGGLLKPIPSGTYLVDEAMIEDLWQEKYQSHASNLGAIMAQELAQAANVQAYIVDPVVVDELQPLARLSGLEEIERRSITHALNQKAVARKVMAEKGKQYNSSNVIVAHLGGGISIVAHQKGRMIDVLNGLDGEGPYSPSRTGALPLYPFAKKIIAENLTLSEVQALLSGKGGLYSYVGETDIQIIETQENRHVLEGMCYQISKAIGEMAVVLKGKVDAIIITGGIAHSQYVIEQVKERTTWIAPVEVVPGQMEMTALYEGVMRVLNGEEKVKRYSEKEGTEWQ